jgi:putative oxidoreductase
MKEFLSSAGLLIFRVLVGLFMLLGHGLGKFIRILSGEEVRFLNLFGMGETVSFYLATFAEFFASALIILGLFNRLSSLSLIITMAVAVFIAHSGDPFSEQEKGLLYLASFLLLFLTGPGKYSLQSLIEKKLKISNDVLKFIFG